MDLIHATDEKIEVGEVKDFVKYDAEISLDPTVKKNSFALTMDESVWESSPIREGHFVYIPNSEWGGPIEHVKHSTKTAQITLSGPTWRGMLARKIVEPPTGSAYLTLSAVEANAALQILFGDKFGDFFAISSVETEIAVSGSYRYTQLLTAIGDTFTPAGLALVCGYDNITRNATVAARKIADYSSLVELSQDYGIYLTSNSGGLETYNHVIALGRGELTERQVIHVYRLDDGTITTNNPGNRGRKDLCTTYDYSNAESEEELVKGATKFLSENAPLRSVDMDTAEITLSLELGDKISARDRLTGLVTTATVKNKTLVISDSGEKIETKVG